MIELLNLTKRYRDFTAVDHISLEVPQGALFGFLGPNGAGKTTTLKMMAGVLKPTSGRIIINGMDLSRQPSEVKRCIGFIPDRPFLYEKLSGNEFLQFIAGLYRMNHAPYLGKRIVELLEIFELSHWADELIESYSHGMKQRLVMCAALLHKPKVLIVDEPMVGLDPKAARLVKDIFKDQAENGTTVFMSTHSLEVAQEVCQEIAIIQAGRVIASGTPDNLREKAGVATGNLEKVFLKLTEGKTGIDEKSLSSS
ncbi:MAG: ABC transporter ATP-binding protein [Deltaproteobacteria bacterium]|nr:ABC transporter ATP-binding protein [Deltaproteobacteria bacterium]MBW2045954.1 ABC transporter ATP-binding protein [Deltaproteobacteria bacterium]MBW2300316.1 ABC transporter ATP-binding protein [Deltaproteobacteria bacterium]